VPKIGRTQLICLLLAGITLALYSQTVKFPFIWCDDQEYVVQNQAIHQGITSSAIEWSFNTFHSANWHPLTWLSHAMDCRFFGLNAGGHHFTNVLFHTANSVLLFLVLLRLTGATWRSAFVAALFAWHPLHVESVAWVSERKDVLSTFFFLLTIWAYAVYVRKLETRNSKPETTSKSQTPNPVPSTRHHVSRFTHHASFFYLLALALFASGLMSKGMLVTLPFVLLLLDYWPLNRYSIPIARGERPVLFKLFLEKIPFLLLSAVCCIATVWAQTVAIMDSSMLPFRIRAGNALTSYVLYLWKTFWPHNLAFYAYRHEPTVFEAVSAGLILLIITGLVLWQIRRRFLFVGWFWFIGTLVPVIGVLQVGFQSMADRYTYIPLIGIFIMLAWGIPDFAVGLTGRLRLSGKNFARPLAVAAGLVLLTVLPITYAQIGYWQDSKTLLGRCIDVTGGTATWENDLGYALYAEGRHEEAAVHYRRATELKPDRLEAMRSPQARARMNLAGVLAEQGDWKGAEEQLRAGLRDLPLYWQARSNLGDSLAAQGRIQEASKEYKGALKIQGGNDAVLWHALGVALNRDGQSAEAVKAYRESVRLDPASAMNLNELAWFLATDPHSELRNGEEAIIAALQACQLTMKQEPRCLGTLDAAYAEAGQFENAISTAQQAKELALARGQPDVAAAADERLKLYRARQPYHQAPIAPVNKPDAANARASAN
jgi:tetratricopeptide (TPR) repeat protein